MGNLTISKKIFIFGIIVFFVVSFATGIKYYMIDKADKNFDIYSNNAVTGKILVLEIGKELNYISRCTRDIMLGNDYEKNIQKIENSLSFITKKFDELELSFNGSTNEKKKKEILKDAKMKTLAFIDDGLSKMKSLSSLDRTPEVLASMYQQYKKDATPLANASRESFSKVSKMKEKGLEIRSAIQHEEMDLLIKLVWIESFIVLILIIGPLFILTKNIVTSIENFKSGLTSFFNFLNRKVNNVELIKINSNDEFGQMATLINENITEVQKTLSDDQKLIDEASVVIQRVKHGWYSQLIETNTSNKTLNTLKDGVNEMIIATKNNFVSVNTSLHEYTNYNYTKELVVDGIEKDGVFDEFIFNINKLRSAINLMLQENKKNGLILDNSATVLLSNVNVLNESSNDAAARLEETAAALEEVTSSIINSTLKITEMSNIANNVTTSANEGEELASKTASSMDEINQKVSAINEAITVIDQIAFQTNILSLNAAVEAATAGEAGKGFAVVAQEVRNLASRSAEAAREIKDLVSDATIKANEGKNISSEMIKGYANLNDNIGQTIELISQITESSREQQSGVEQINDAINNLDKQTQENAVVANTTNTIAKQTSLLAQEIVKNTDDKEFEGKNSIKFEEEKVKVSNKTETTVPHRVEKIEISKPIVSSKSDSDDEWESF